MTQERLTLWTLAAILGATLCLRLPPLICQSAKTDEECYAVPGFTIVRTGLPQLPHMPSRNPESMFYHADDILYAEPPLFFYLQAAVYSILPVSYGASRVVSLLSSVVVCVMVYGVARRLTKHPSAALWAVGLLGLSRWFYYSVTLARPDMLCACFGMAAVLATFQWLERRSRWRLIAVGFSRSGLSKNLPSQLDTHPIATFGLKDDEFACYAEIHERLFERPAKN